MRWPLHRKPSPDLEHARRVRRQAEEEFRRDQEHVILPLREIRAVNHVAEDIGRLIRRRVHRESGEA